MVHLELDFWLMLEPCDPAGTLPEFNVMAVHKLLCLFRSFHVVGAFERNQIDEMPVRADDVNAIIRQVAAPFGSGGSAILSVTEYCRGPGGDVPHMGIGCHSKQAKAKSNQAHKGSKYASAPTEEEAYFGVRPGRIGPIAQIGCGVGQAGSPEQVVFFFARRKLRGFFFDPASERRDAILERFGLCGTATLHGHFSAV